MCGIVGFVEQNRPTLLAAERQVRKMADTLTHRGPDGYGCWVDGNIGFGHRRLSIQDLSEAGHQPMSSDSERFTMVFNGEIYNHLELRNALQESGVKVQWRGHSDSETLLECISLWGLDKTLQKAKGMFAIALWDKKLQNLCLARDRIGEKPLYYGWSGSAFVFGSELKALLAHDKFERNIEPTALQQFVRFGYVPAPLSIWCGVYKLEPGTILEISGDAPPAPPSQPLRSGSSFGTIGIRSFWSLAERFEHGKRNQYKNHDEGVAALESALNAAVKRQLISDVPVGAFLSGGIDSSTIVALMQQCSSTQVKTFTIGFHNKAFDESPHAKKVAEHLETEHHEFFVTDQEAQDVIPTLPHLYDEPFADSSQIPTFLVSQMARKSVTVALSGDAGDELFGGYNRYFWSDKVWRYFASLPFPLRSAIGKAALNLPVSSLDRLGKLLNYFRQGSSGLAFFGDKVHRLADRLTNVQNIDDLYFSLVCQKRNPMQMLNASVIKATVPSVFDYPMPKSGSDDPIDRMMYRDMMTYLPDDILCKVDRAAMGASLETRVPFLDPDVIDVSTRMARQSKIQNNIGKWPVREILYKHVPREVIDRPKAGFGIPVGAWLRGPLRPWAEATLWGGNKPLSDYFNVKEVQFEWQEHLSGRRDATSFLWSVLTFQAWREVWH
jgi:asparagine synthase (glutamine-hydrolysing)